MSGVTAHGRLAEEHKSWQKNGFVAKPETSPDGSVNLMVWHCSIPGIPATDWEGGSYPITMYFSEDYPTKPPKCQFPEGCFHPNVYLSGTICMPILDEDREWMPDLSIEQILMDIQDLLDWPKPKDPAHSCYQLYINDQDEYKKRVNNRPWIMQLIPKLKVIKI